MEQQTPGPSLLYAVKQLELAVRARLDELLRPAGVTVLQYTALTVLERRDGVTASELARNSFVTPQAMADLITALEGQQLVHRARDPRDGRRLVLTLAPAGHELLQRCARSVGGLERRMTAGLSKPESQLMRELVNRCREALHDL